MTAPTPRRRSTGHWVVLAGALAGVLVLLAARGVLEPDPRGFGTHEQLGMKPCVAMDSWGFPCPGCGVTTSVTLASHGRLVDSFLAQPFGLLLALGAVLFLPWSLVTHFRGRDLAAELRRIPFVPAALALTAIAVLAWGYRLVAHFFLV